MTDQDKRAFADALTALGLATGAVVTKPLLAAYWALLRPLPLETFLTATEAAGRTLRWFPRPAELLDLGGAGASARKAAIAAAWEAVRAAMDRYDYLQTVDFGPTVNAVIRNMGGWQWLCGRSERALTWDRKKFEELTELYVVSPPHALRGEPLPGTCFPRPVRIAIDGRLPALRTETPRAELPAIVRELAEQKSQSNPNPAEARR
jgi:hypothetical protein